MAVCHGLFIWNQRWKVLRAMQEPQQDNRASGDPVKNKVIRISPQWPHPHFGRSRKPCFGRDLRMRCQHLQCRLDSVAEAICRRRVHIRQIEDNFTVILQEPGALKKFVSHAVDESGAALTGGPHSSEEKARSLQPQGPFAPSTNRLPFCAGRPPE